MQCHVDRLRAVLPIRGKLAFRLLCGSPVTVIVIRAGLRLQVFLWWYIVVKRDCLPLLCLQWKETGLKTRSIVAENGHKNKSTLGVFCRSGIFGYLCMNEIIAVSFLVQAYKKKCHGDGSVIYTIVVAVGFFCLYCF